MNGRAGRLDAGGQGYLLKVGDRKDEPSRRKQGGGVSLESSGYVFVGDISAKIEQI